MALQPLTRDDYATFELRFKQLQYADDFISAEETDTRSQVVQRREAYIDVAVVLEEIMKGYPDPKIIYMYADTVVASKEIVLPPKRPQMYIFARCMFPQSCESEPVCFNASEGAQIKLWSAGFSERDIYLKFYTKSGEQVSLHTESTREEGTIGLDFAVDNGVSKPERLVKLERAMIPSLDLTKQLLDDKKRKELGLEDPENENVVRLLNYQMLLATAWAEEGRYLPRPHAPHLAAFVERMTRGFPQMVDLNLQASSFSKRYFGAQSLVPAVDLSVTKQVLKARLRSILAFEDSLEKFARTMGDQNAGRVNAELTLATSLDADSTFNFVRDQTRKRYEEGLAALATAESYYAVAHKTFVAKQNGVDAGIKKWQTEQMEEAVKKMILAIVQGVTAVAVAVYNPAGGAAGVAAAGESATKALHKSIEVAEKIDEFKKMIDNIKKLWDLIQKIRPVLMKVKDSVEKTTKSLSLIEGLVAAGKSKEEALKKAATLPDLPEDTINLKADWELFRLKVQEVLDGDVFKGIHGVSDLRKTVDPLVIRALAVLDCQRDLKQSSDQWHLALQQSKASSNQTRRLRVAIMNLQAKAKTSIIFKTAMLERIMALRVWLWLDFQAYVGAYMWYSLDPDPPIQLDPMKRLEYFVNDAALLQAAIAQADERIRSQERVFKLSIPADLPGEADWKTSVATAQETRSFVFKIDRDHLIFKDFSRLRIRRLRFVKMLTPTAVSTNSHGRTFLNGVRAPTSTVRTALSFGGKMEDRTVGSMPSFRCFEMPHTPIFFEYGTCDQSQITLDGELQYSGTYVKPSPFSQWTIMVLQDQIDLNLLESIEIEMLCSVTPCGNVHAFPNKHQPIS